MNLSPFCRGAVTGAFSGRRLLSAVCLKTDTLTSGQRSFSGVRGGVASPVLFRRDSFSTFPDSGDDRRMDRRRFHRGVVDDVGTPLLKTEMNGQRETELGPETHFDGKGLDFLERIVDLIIEEVIVKGCSESSKVVDFIQPEELRQRLDLDLDVKDVNDFPDNGVDDDRLFRLCRDVVETSVKTGHPMFFNQLYQGLDPHGVAGALLTEALNTNNFTFEVAPVFVLLEEILLEKFRHLVGYPVKQEDGGDGIFCPGGSISNMFALNLARYQKFPEVKRQGMKNMPEMAVFTSEHSHYSIKKGLIFLGYGLDSLVTIPCDSGGRMIPEALDEAIQTSKAKGVEPVMVNATCGTTVYGAYDPLEAISQVCQRHGVWLHVDACWGGGVLVSRHHRHKMAGVNLTDSVAWCFHKMLGSPLQCSPFVTKHKGLLSGAHSLGATYLFQQDKAYDVKYDIGDKTVQCGRKADALKMWTIWKAKGDKGLESEIDHTFELVSYIHAQILEREGFESVTEEHPSCTNVCFWYVPSHLRKRKSIESVETEALDTAVPDAADSVVPCPAGNNNNNNGVETRDAAWWSELGGVAPYVKRRMMERGSMLIGYQPLGDKPNFFRLVVTRKPSLRRRHMDKILDEIQRLGEELAGKTTTTTTTSTTMTTLSTSTTMSDRS